MNTETRVVGALALCAVLGGAFYMSNSGAKAEKEGRATSASKADLPDVTLKPEDLDKVVKLELKSAEKAGADGKMARTTIVLEKKGAEWALTAPIQAKANQADVKTLLDGLKELKITEAIDRGTAAYDQHEVNDKLGVQLTAYDAAGAKRVDVVFGKKGGRGQMLRVVGTDGVFLDADYQTFLMTKEAKGWRDKSILKIEGPNVVEVEIDNEHGHYLFMREGDNWTGDFKKNPNKKAEPAKTDEHAGEEPKKDESAADKPKDEKKADKPKDERKADKPKKSDEAEAGTGKGWPKFDGKEVESMLQAFKALSAIDFADAAEETGLEGEAAPGGWVKITMKDGTVHMLRFGNKQKGANRFLKKADDETVWVVSAYASDWATAEPVKFEKKEKKDGPPGMPGMDPHGGMDMPDMDLEIPE